MEESQEEKKEKKSSVPLACQGCVRWEKFGKQCFYYWEGKKHCTMWTSNYNDLLAM